MDLGAFIAAAVLAAITLLLLHLVKPKPQAPDRNRRDMVPVTAPGTVQNPTLHVAAFLSQAIRPSPRGEVSIRALYDSYLLWSIKRNVDPLDAERVGQLFVAAFAARGYNYVHVGDDIVLKRAELVSDPPQTRGLPKMLADLTQTAPTLPRERDLRVSR